MYEHNTSGQKYERSRRMFEFYLLRFVRTIVQLIDYKGKFSRRILKSIPVVIDTNCILLYLGTEKTHI